MQQRLQKILSAHGVSSRRESERLIESGRVSVNGVPAVLGQSADPDFDDIRVDGAPVRAGVHKLYIMLNKPKGYVTTLKDERGRRSVAELVDGCGERVWPVGRLDLDSEGLLILTNDGELTHFLTHPSNEKPKTYRVRVRGDVTGALPILSGPMRIDGYDIRPADVRLLGRTPDGGNLDVTIHEGRNRQVRKMCDAAGLGVVSLRRVAEGGLHLGRLKAGDWRYLTAEEVRRLKAGMDGSPAAPARRT
jgi:23S rRNA pseudouridine2605 synthase